MNARLPCCFSHGLPAIATTTTTAATTYLQLLAQLPPSSLDERAKDTQTHVNSTKSSSYSSSRWLGEQSSVRLVLWHKLYALLLPSDAAAYLPDSKGLVCSCSIGEHSKSEQPANEVARTTFGLPIWVESLICLCLHFCRCCRNKTSRKVCTRPTRLHVSNIGRRLRRWGGSKGSYRFRLEPPQRP